MDAADKEVLLPCGQRFQPRAGGSRLRRLNTTPPKTLGGVAFLMYLDGAILPISVRLVLARLQVRRNKFVVVRQKTFQYRRRPPLRPCHHLDEGFEIHVKARNGDLGGGGQNCDDVSPWPAVWQDVINGVQQHRLRVVAQRPY